MEAKYGRNKPRGGAVTIRGRALVEEAVAAFASNEFSETNQVVHLQDHA